MAQRHSPLSFPDRPRNLKIGDELNRGAWGAVYNGELEGHPVAVKRIHELLHQGRSEEERRKVFGDFREECKKLQALSHPHVVGFIGAFNDSRLGPILVMEKMEENLRDFLDKQSKRLSLPKQLRISLEIIRGVAFLHQQTPPLVHRDLNDKNVMFSFDGIMKIGDFGQSKLKKDLYLTSGQPGMVTFMPPEALDVDESKYNESLDIFSVGVLMLEIGTQQEPLVNLRGIGIIHEVDRRERDLKALGEDHPLRPQILLCLKDNPKERPKASDLQREVLALVDGGVEATADGLRSQIATLQAALAEAREENAARRDHEAKLTSKFQAGVASHDANIRQLEERCEQWEAQATTYKLDFEQERIDRQDAMGRFDMERGAFQETIEKMNEKLKAIHLKHDETVAHLEQMKEISVTQKKELKEKEERLQHTRGSSVGLEQKLSKLHTQHETLSKENAALRAQLKNWEKDMKAFKAIEGAYQKAFEEAKTYKEEARANKELYHDAESKRAAAASRVHELTMTVNAIEAKGHGNAGENMEALKEDNRRLKTQFNALEAASKRVTTEKQQLAFDYQNLQKLYGALQRENEALKSQQRVIASDSEMSLATRCPQGGQVWFLGDSIHAGVVPLKDDDSETDPLQDSPPSSTIKSLGSSLKPMSVAPTPRPRTRKPEGISMNAGRSVHPGSVSTGPSTEDDLPMTLTRPGARVVPFLQPNVSEDIDSEIRHEAYRCKEAGKAEASPVHADDEEWPLDPNLTCPYCNVVFRRGQMREFRHHVDDCREA